MCCGQQCKQVPTQASESFGMKQNTTSFSTAQTGALFLSSQFCRLWLPPRATCWGVPSTLGTSMLGWHRHGPCHPQQLFLQVMAGPRAHLEALTNGVMALEIPTLLMARVISLWAVPCHAKPNSLQTASFHSPPHLPQTGLVAQKHPKHPSLQPLPVPGPTTASQSQGPTVPPFHCA